MFAFRQSAALRRELVEVKSQRDPKSYMGLERMLLAWVSTMGFVVTTSLLLLQLEGAPARVLQYIWLPFAAIGVGFATWRYYLRLNTLQSLHKRVDVAVRVDLWAYYGMVLLILAVVLSVFVLSLVQHPIFV